MYYEEFDWGTKEGKLVVQGELKPDETSPGYYVCHLLSERKVKVGVVRLKHSAKDRAIYSNFKAEREASWQQTVCAKKGGPGCHRTEPPTFDGYMGVVRKQENEKGFCALAMRLTTVHRDSVRCYDPAEARSVLPDLWKIPAAEEFPTKGFEAGLENGCIRTTVHGDKCQIFPDEDCTVKLRVAIKKALNPPLSFGGPTQAIAKAKPKSRPVQKSKPEEELPNAASSRQPRNQVALKRAEMLKLKEKGEQLKKFKADKAKATKWLQQAQAAMQAKTKSGSAAAKKKALAKKAPGKRKVMSL